jgi:uncharacterized protein (TIGR03435 family)
MRGLKLRVAIAVTVFASFGACALAQTPAAAAPAVAPAIKVPEWQKAAGGKMEFDVASVRPSGPDAKIKMNFPLGPGDVYSPTGGILSATDLPLIAYIAFAYKITGNQASAILHQLPGWVTSDRFDIEAKSDNHDATKDQMRLMMQALLADRFKLGIHLETQQVPVFGLVLVKPGKLGPHLQQHPADAVCSNSSAPPSPGGPLPTVAGGYPVTCGGIVGVPKTGTGTYAIGARNVTMALISSNLGGAPGIDRPIVDQTGLTGTFDFTLEFSLDNGSAAPSANPSTDAQGPTLLEAFTEQLGMKLVPTKGPVDVYIVDHVEKPSAN